MLLASVIVAGFTLAICLMADRIGGFLGVLDAPDNNRKLHVRTTPLVGGLAVVLPIVCAGPWLAGSAESSPSRLNRPLNPFGSLERRSRPRP